MVAEPDWAGDISSWLRELLEVSQRAWDSAASRDFTGLAVSIEERDRILKGFKAIGDATLLAPHMKKQIVDVLLTVRKIDGEIRKALRDEMEQDNRAIRDTANKAKALSAYDRTLNKPRRFDRLK